MNKRLSPDRIADIRQGLIDHNHWPPHPGTVSDLLGHIEVIETDDQFWKDFCVTRETELLKIVETQDEEIARLKEQNRNLELRAENLLEIAEGRHDK